MEAALRLAIWCILLLCGVIQNVLAASEIIPKDYTNMVRICRNPSVTLILIFMISLVTQLCDLASGKEGICVFAYLCNDGVINTNGTAILDLRYMDVCKDYFLKCCSKESVSFKCFNITVKILGSRLSARGRRYCLYKVHERLRLLIH